MIVEVFKNCILATILFTVYSNIFVKPVVPLSHNIFKFFYLKIFSLDKPMACIIVPETINNCNLLKTESNLLRIRSYHTLTSFIYTSRQEVVY